MSEKKKTALSYLTTATILFAALVGLAVGGYYASYKYAPNWWFENLAKPIVQWKHKRLVARLISDNPKANLRSVDFRDGDEISYSAWDKSDMCVSDFSYSKPWLQLDSIYVSDPVILNMRFLAGVSLERLTLSGSHITDLSTLKGGALEKLDISDTSVTDISPLKGMTTLRELDVTGCKIKDFSPLDGMNVKIVKTLPRPHIR